MPLSAAKQEKIARFFRVREVWARSLDGRGHFLDANHDAAARRYVDSGDPADLESLPNYPEMRRLTREQGMR